MLNLNPAIWETIAATGWRNTNAEQLHRAEFFADDVGDAATDQRGGGGPVIRLSTTPATALATPAISTIVPMLSRCAFEDMRIPFRNLRRQGWSV
jgi:hypothetical protein